jgi:hypothetical protein
MKYCNSKGLNKKKDMQKNTNKNTQTHKTHNTRRSKKQKSKKKKKEENLKQAKRFERGFLLSHLLHTDTPTLHYAQKGKVASIDTFNS